MKKSKENVRHFIEYSNASLIKSKTDKGYTCYACPQLFQNPRALKAHFLEIHTTDIHKIQLDTKHRILKLDITDLKCILCDEGFDNLELFAKHLSEHDISVHLDACNQIVPYKFDSDVLRCALCNQEHNNFKNLCNHTNKHFRNYICEFCDAGFITYLLYKNHKQNHGKGEHQCAYCDKLFKTKVRAREHERQVHLGYKKNKCPICSMGFTNAWSKLSHMSGIHGVHGIEYACKACNKVYADQRMLREHQKKYHLMENSHICELCGLGFFTKLLLTKHHCIKKAKKTFECEVCCELFPIKLALTVHMKSHKNDDIDEDEVQET